MWGLSSCLQIPRVDSERGAFAAELSGTPGEDGHSAQVDPQADLSGNEWRGRVHSWENKEQSPATDSE